MYTTRTPIVLGRPTGRLFLGILLVLGVGVTAPRTGATQPEPTLPQPGTHAPAPHLSVDRPKLDLGTVQAGDVVPMVWQLSNTGEADLVISRIKPGCGCTIVSYAEENRIIPPGGTVELDAEFHSKGRRGEQDKEVVIFSNDPEHPKFGLSFHAFVDRLFEVVPNERVDLRNVQRGSTARRTIDVVEDLTRGAVTVVGIDVPDGTPLEFDVKPFHESGVSGQRISVTVLDAAATGKLKVHATLRIQVGKTIREHEVTIRAEVRGEITWLLKVVDATRRMLRPGNVLAPVTVLASSGVGFHVLGVTTSGRLDAAEERRGSAGPVKRHVIRLTVRDDVPPGPFGETLRIETDALDQPVIEIPVYGFVMPALEIEPPVVILRADGTPAGSVRQVRLKTYPGTTLNITSYKSALEAVSVRPSDARKSQRHIKFVEVRLTEPPPTGTQDSTITIGTNIPGFDHVEIPVKLRPAD